MKEKEFNINCKIVYDNSIGCYKVSLPFYYNDGKMPTIIIEQIGNKIYLNDNDNLQLRFKNWDNDYKDLFDKSFKELLDDEEFEYDANFTIKYEFENKNNDEHTLQKIIEFAMKLILFDNKY